MKQNIYFVGAGGIGMANLVRYCLHTGKHVAGYDRTQTALTDALVSEGAEIIYRDSVELIPEQFRNSENTLVVYTPAIPEDNEILTFFKKGKFEIVKRAALLGAITRSSKGICVAGSHGKTTTSSMIAHILNISKVGCNAFLGGILRNYDSNLILSDQSPFSVIEADEYDRSFHHLSPYIAIITSTDPDHLDIYGNEANYLEAFSHFSSLIKPGGCLIMHSGLKMKPRTADGVRVITYSATDAKAECRAQNIRCKDGHLYFDYVGENGMEINDIELGVPVNINIDNAVAAITASLLAGAGEDDIRTGLATFLGAKRRFEIWMHTEKHLLIDDYAHSPREVEASIASVRALYPDRKISVIFQPHLYTRTRDFAPEFAQALSTADEVLMCEIYPAREKPIAGVSSQIIFDKVESQEKTLILRTDLLNKIKNSNFEILMTLGAADINLLCPEIKQILENSEK